jgi:hypothetical protein
MTENMNTVPEILVHFTSIVLLKEYIFKCQQTSMRLQIKLHKHFEGNMAMSAAISL